MKILVVNCGSSSVKYRLYEMPEERLLARGNVERIGELFSSHSHVSGECECTRQVKCADHTQALKLMATALMGDGDAVIASPDEVAAVGHRVVHGGEAFVESVIIDDAVERAVHELFPLAPLHNPPNLKGVHGARAIFPKAPHVAVFDTAFHRSMPPRAFHYAIPYELYEKEHLRKYGFHGTSYRYVVSRCAELAGVPEEEFNAIACHLGNGSSMTAVRGGRSVDTTMGVTPLEGLIMGTRSGDIDPGVIFYLMANLGMTAQQVGRTLNKESGVLGLSGVSNDMRAVMAAAAEGNERAQLALDCYHYRARKYVGAYMAALGEVHAVIFTGGIGENARESRAAILEGMETLGIEIDDRGNMDCQATEARISTDDSRVQVWVIPTNEEIMIARDTFALTSATAR